MKDKLQGDWKTADIGHPIEYFQQRDTYLDVRGDIHISPLSHFSFFNAIITASHNTQPGYFGEVVLKKVIVKDYAWITSGCILYNCIIGEHSIVAVGSVVRDRIVPDWTMVEGNPAKIVARFDKEKNKWVHQEPEDLGWMK